MNRASAYGHMQKIDKAPDKSSEVTDHLVGEFGGGGLAAQVRRGDLADYVGTNAGIGNFSRLT